MKYLILFLISFNSLASFEAHYISKTTGSARQTIEAETKVELNNLLVEKIKSSSWMKGAWSETKKDSVAVETVLDGDSQVFIKRYYHPINFRVIPARDNTKDKKDRKDRYDRRKFIRNKLKTKDLSLKEINELLRK